MKREHMFVLCRTRALWAKHNNLRLECEQQNAIADYLEQQASQEPMTEKEIKKHCDGKAKWITIKASKIERTETWRGSDDETWN